MTPHGRGAPTQTPTRRVGPQPAHLPPRSARASWLVAALVVAAALVSGGGALAQGASIVVEPAGPLPASGGTLTVTGTGFTPAGNGVYVVFGPITPAPGYYMDPSLYGAFKWVHAGAADTPATAPLAADGSFSTTLAVQAALTTPAGPVDCGAVACGVITFAAHGSPDRSQDTCVAVSFVTDGIGSPVPAPSAQVPSSPDTGGRPTASSGPTTADACAPIGQAVP